MKDMGEDFEGEAELLRRYMNKMDPPGKKKAVPPPGGAPANTKSTYNVAYDSIFTNGSKISGVLTGLGGNYNPSDTNITAASYDALVASLKTLSSNIASVEKDLKPLTKRRERLYNSKVDGFKKIINGARSYVKNNYGTGTPEYDSVKNIKV